jgi:hypothetical protein
MTSDTRSLLRGLGAIGATVAVLATFLPWYSFQAVLDALGVQHLFAVPVTLWDLTTLAPALIVAGATIALVMLAVVEGRAAGAITALIGLAIGVYAVVRCFDVPHLQIPGPLHTVTTLGGGAPLAIAAGLMLLIGALPDLFAAPEEEPAAAGTPARTAAPAFRRRRGAGAYGRVRAGH